MQKLILIKRDEQGRVARKFWVVQNTDNGVVGTYNVSYRADGTPYSASRDYHAPGGDPRFPHGTDVKSCIFQDGNKCRCDGAFTSIIDDNAEAFAIAEGMALSYTPRQEVTA